MFSQLDEARAWLASTQDATLSQQIALASIAAPTGEESPRAHAMARALQSVLGVAVERDAVGNVLARVDPPDACARAEAPVVLMAHLDTVFASPDLPPVRREAQRVTLPGIGDNGRGLAALVTLGAALQRNEVRSLLRRPVELVATVGEEGAGNLRGAKQYFADRPGVRAAAVIAIDGPGDSHVVHYGIASRRLHIAFDGPGGHPWADRAHPNAAHALGTAISMVSRARGPVNATMTVSRVGGGESLTSIPRHAWLDIDLRALNSADLRALDALVRRIAVDAARSAAGHSTPIHVSFDVLGDRPGGTIDARHPLVDLAVDASRWHAIDAQSASASTDANVALSLGIPAIAIGAGGAGGGAHSSDEWYDDTNSARGLSRALGIIVGATQLPTA